MRKSRGTLEFGQIALQTACGAIAVIAITAVCYALHADFPIVGCLYLLVVVVQSVRGIFLASAVVSVFAVLCLDYFFVPPIFTLQIDRPLDALALVTFLTTALVITRLASRAQQEARKAERSRQDLARLYDLASRLVSVSSDVTVKREYLSIFRSVFQLHAICLFDSTASECTCDGKSQLGLQQLTKLACTRGNDYVDDSGIAIRCLRTGGALIGAIGFEGLEEPNALAGPLAVLAAAMVQRAGSFLQASEAAAATQVEVLRTAILDAFAHRFKTPLATILAAAGSLRETGPLVSEQEEMVETIERHAAGLGHLTTRLLRMARLDRDEITPRLRTTDLAGLMRRLSGEYGVGPGGQELVIRIEKQPLEVLSDPEMLGLAIIQLLDNAFCYSPPGARITVIAGIEARNIVVRVANPGPPIPVQEQGRIFDRFYRGSAGRETAGTGLGLYVARKIVLAHGGSLDLDNDHDHGRQTVFCLRLPLAGNESPVAGNEAPGAGTEVKDEIKASESVGRR
jgi:two-component system, OmpR family, sensor histidine kinase KdpD